MQERYLSNSSKLFIYCRQDRIRIGTFLTVDLFQPPEHIPIKRIDLFPIWVCKTSASVNATAGYESRTVRNPSPNRVPKTKFTSAALICDRGEFLKRNLSEIIRPTSPNRQREQQLPTQRASSPHQTSSGFPAKNHFFHTATPANSRYLENSNCPMPANFFSQYKCRVTFLHLIGFADTTEPPRH